MSNPSPGRRTLIAAASVSLALASLATTVATADATRPGSPGGSRGRLGRRAHVLLRQLRHRQAGEATRPRATRPSRLAWTARSGPRVTSSRCPGPDGRPVPRGDRPDLHRARRVRRRAVPETPPKGSIGPPPDGSTTDVTGPLHNEIPRAEPRDRQQHAVAGGLRPRALRGHVLQPDAGVLRDPVLGPLHHRRHVTEWVKVPFNEALYGRNYCGSIVCNTSKALVRDALAMWVDSKLHPTDGSAPMTLAAIHDYLATFDVEDRYDYDDDGSWTSPTASSTTSRSSTPAVTRPPTTPTRARTRSGATARAANLQPAATSASASTSAPTPAW